MNKLLIVSGTNRQQSNSLRIANEYKHLSNALEIDTSLLSLESLNGMEISDAMYTEEGQHHKIKKLQDEFFEPASHIVIIIPEYNGTFPGILKFFIDAISVRNYKSTFSGKKVAMVGVSSGKAGCLRGLDQLTNALNYLGIEVMKNKIPISNISTVLTTDGLDDKVKDLLTGQVKELFELK